MTPEELNELRKSAAMVTQIGTHNAEICKHPYNGVNNASFALVNLPGLLAHIDQQTAQIKQHENTIDLLQNEPFEFRKGKDAHEAISDLIEKYEDRIAGLQACIRIRDVRNGELVVQIEALKEKLVEATAKEIYPFNMPQWENLPEEDCWKDNELFGKSRQVGKATYRYHARQQLAEEMPEVDWE